MQIHPSRHVLSRSRVIVHGLKLTRVSRKIKALGRTDQVVEHHHLIASPEDLNACVGQPGLREGLWRAQRTPREGAREQALTVHGVAGLHAKGVHERRRYVREVHGIRDALGHGGGRSRPAGR